jgi:hypothetical protein
VSETTPGRGSEHVPDVGSSHETAEIPVPAERTVEIPSAPLARLNPGVSWLFLTIAAAAFLAGVGIGALVHPASPGAVVASATVGPSGGIVTFDRNAELRIPAGALAAPVHLTVRRTTIDEAVRVNPPDGPLYVFRPRTLAAYTFSPRSVTFARPATIVLPLADRKRNAAVFSYLEGSVLFLTGDVDPESGTVSIDTTDFRFRSGLAPADER